MLEEKRYETYNEIKFLARKVEYLANILQNPTDSIKKESFEKWSKEVDDVVQALTKIKKDVINVGR